MQSDSEWEAHLPVPNFIPAQDEWMDGNPVEKRYDCARRITIVPQNDRTFCIPSGGTEGAGTQATNGTMGNHFPLPFSPKTLTGSRAFMHTRPPEFIHFVCLLRARPKLKSKMLRKLLADFVLMETFPGGARRFTKFPAISGTKFQLKPHLAVENALFLSSVAFMTHFVYSLIKLSA